MNRKRLIILAVSVAGAGIIAADRVWSGPASAEANTVPSRPASGAPSPRPRKIAAKSEVDKPLPAVDPSLTYLDQLGPAKAPRDIFAPSTGLLAMYSTLLAGQSAAAKSEPKGPKPGSVEAFVNDHKLQATFTGPAAVAVVNGRPLRVGESVGGYRLASVQPWSAEFCRGKRHVTLTLPTPTGAARAE